jgi:hypothetical protein
LEIEYICMITPCTTKLDDACIFTWWLIQQLAAIWFACPLNDRLPSVLGCTPMFLSFVRMGLRSQYVRRSGILWMIGVNYLLLNPNKKSYVAKEVLHYVYAFLHVWSFLWRSFSYQLREEMSFTIHYCRISMETGYFQRDFWLFAYIYSA